MSVCYKELSEKKKRMKRKISQDNNRFDLKELYKYVNVH